MSEPESESEDPRERLIELVSEAHDLAEKCNDAAAFILAGLWLALIERREGELMAAVTDGIAVVSMGPDYTPEEEPGPVSVAGVTLPSGFDEESN